MFMANEPAMTPIEGIETKIHSIRAQRVMLDSDLAAIYGVSTMRLNEQLKRNLKRFPLDFAFQLTREEFAALTSQTAISKKARGGRRHLPWVFTEHGAIMLASVLNSERAVEMSVFVVRSFIRMREMLVGNRQLSAKVQELENKIGEHDEALAHIVQAIRQLIDGPAAAAKREREIGFHIKETAPRYRAARRA